MAAAFAACFFAIVCSGCKEDTILGANVVPVDDTANTFVVGDTLTILTKTVLSNKYVTSTSISGLPIYHALGTVANDPYGGKTHAGFYFSVVPPSLGYSFPARPDSAFLVLPYAGLSWGDTTLTNLDQLINVYEIADNDSLSLDSTYYNYSSTAYNSQPIGTATIGFNSSSQHGAIKDSVNVLGTLRNPHVRVRLSQAFIDKMYNEASKTSGSAYDAYADFARFLHGFYVAPADTNSGNSLYYFLLNGGTDFNRANIQFFYTKDTVNYVSFYYDQTRVAHYNHIVRNPSVSPTLDNLLHSTTTSDSIFILQNEPGAALDVKIPFIKNLPKQPIIRAELILTQYKIPGDESEKYYGPARLYPVRMQGDSAVSVQDRSPITSTEPLIFMDGLRKDVTINGATYSQYTINIPREVQRAIIEQRDTLHLRIGGAATFPAAYRLIGGGRNLSNSDVKLKLRIFYSKI